MNSWGQNVEGMNIQAMRQLVFISSSSLAHLLLSCFPPPSFSLPHAPWKDSVIPFGSKCDIFSLSFTLNLPFLTLPPLPPCPSLGSVCFGPCHHHALCGFSHDGGEPSLVNYRTPGESQRERQREWRSQLFLAPDIGPIRDFSLSSCPSLSLWSMDLLNRWNEHFETSLIFWTHSSVCCPAANSRLFCFVSYSQTFMPTVFGFEGLSQQVLHVLWIMTNIIILPFTLILNTLPEQIATFS